MLYVEKLGGSRPPVHASKFHSISLHLSILFLNCELRGTAIKIARLFYDENAQGFAGIMQTNATPLALSYGR